MAENMAASNQEQDINPWSVEGARDENGDVASIDYEAISQYVCPQRIVCNILTAAENGTHPL